MQASWIVNVGGRPYGPYTDAQMATFAAEGRVAPQSLVARNGENNYRPAMEEEALAPLFETAAKPAAGAGDPVTIFGRQNDDRFANGERGHIVIIADMKSRSIDGVEEEIFRLGPAYALLPQVWLLRTDQSVTAVRNILIQQLGKLDTLFLVDATNDKAAWFNFGPETDVRIRRLWFNESHSRTGT